MLYICAQHRDTRLWNTFISAEGLPESEWQRYPIESDSPASALKIAQRLAHAMQLLDDDALQLLLALALEAQQWPALSEALMEGIPISVPAAWYGALSTLEAQQLVTLTDPDTLSARLIGPAQHYRPALPAPQTLAA